MPSIDDFINKRWADAKEELRQRDPSFVAKYEELATKARSEDSILEVPEQVLWLPGQGPVSFFTHRDPKKRLSRKWHSLLEACVALTKQVSIVKIAANSLTADMYKALPDIEVGRQFDYHRNSLIIHMLTLCERVKKVIEVTAAVYIADNVVRKSINEQYRSLVEPIRKRLEDLRNEVVHPRGSLGAEGITEDQLWEQNVAVGITAQMLLNEFYWPTRGERIKRGEYNWYVDGTDLLLDELDSIIGELEKDLAI